ncbi:MAG: MFS transporter, partial [Nitrososphaeraceae archaeon]|nr:MFS transporter [Nitrososphaeraceae archaeon]
MKILTILFKRIPLTLFLARVLYTINWFNVSSIFYFISLDFHLDISSLGLITTSFIIGVGIFQIPAGILAAKFGSRRLSIFGILFSSVMVIISGMLEDIIQIAILRFLVGIGMACFFGPSITLITKFLGEKNTGLGVGILNSAHAIGALIGIFGWIPIADLIGWHLAIIIGGVCGVIITILMELNLINDLKTRIKIEMRDLKIVLLNRSLITLGFALLGFQTGASLTLTFMVIFLIEKLNVEPVLAGFFGSLSLITGIIVSPVFGKIYNKIQNTKKLLFICSLISASSIMLLYIHSVYVVIGSIIVAGTCLSMGFVVVYAKAKQDYGIKTEYQTLAISFVNGISLTGSFWIPLVFSYFVHEYGYDIA